LIGLRNAIPALDFRLGFRQAQLVETPPILPPEPKIVRPRRKSRGKLFIFSGLVLGLLALTIFWAFHKKEVPIPIQTEKVARRTITETVMANGKIYPVIQVHISPEVSGEITELAVKEGQRVNKGDLLLKIKPDVYQAAVDQTKANYQSSIAAKVTAAANLEKAEADFKRNQELFHNKLISESDFVSYKVARDVAQAQLESSIHQVDVAQATVDSALESLNKTTITSPIDGTISKLNSQAGERVLGTVQNAGTDIMVISDLSTMEARVDIGETDIVLLHPGEKAFLEVDSFKDEKFAGVVTDVASSSEGLNSATTAYSSSSSSSQSATQFQVRIRFNELAAFRPGMSVSATIETRTRTNTLTAPIPSITTRLLKPKTGTTAKNTTGATNAPATNELAAATNAASSSTNSMRADKKANEKNKPVEVAFVVADGHVKTMPVKLGISDENYWEITEGLKEGDEIVTGSSRAISRDLDDGKAITKTPAPAIAGFDQPKS
jgi:HlyD family secretion protein